jgi:drug/metabolite transporter (DMT)-like permease
VKYFSNQSQSYLYAGGAIFFWSTIASAFKLSLDYLAPEQLVFFASIFSTFALFIFILVQGKLPLVAKLKRSDLVRYCFLGLLNPCLYYIVLLHAYDLLPAQEAMAINYSWVIMMAILSMPILKQVIGFGTFFAIAVSYFGVIIIATEGNPLSLEFTSGLGVMLALLSTIIWAVFWLFNTKDSGDSVVALFVIFLFSIFFVSISMFFSPYSKPITVNGLIGSAYIGFFEMGITFVLWQSALSLSSQITKITTLAFVTPFLSLLIIYIVLGEEILPSSFFGIALIISGLIMNKYFAKD